MLNLGSELGHNLIDTALGEQQNGRDHVVGHGLVADLQITRWSWKGARFRVDWLEAIYPNPEPQCAICFSGGGYFLLADDPREPR